MFHAAYIAAHAPHRWLVLAGRRLLLADLLRLAHCRGLRAVHRHGLSNLRGVLSLYAAAGGDPQSMLLLWERVVAGLQRRAATNRRAHALHNLLHEPTPSDDDTDGSQ